MSASDDVAHSTSARRRAGESVTPSGKLCSGLTTTASTPSSASTRSPSRSTGTGTSSSPDEASVAVRQRWPGSSTPIRVAPFERKTFAIVKSACVEPAWMPRLWCVAVVPRVRPRNAASRRRSSDEPNGSPYARSVSAAPRSAVRPAESHADRGKSARSGRSGRKLNCADATCTSCSATCSRRSTGSRATTGAAPLRTTRYASAANWAYAPTITPRETSRSAANTRVEGSGSPAAIAPVRISRRSSASSWRPSGLPGSRRSPKSGPVDIV